MLYKRLFTVAEINENFGYDLMTIANQGGFVTQESACDAWCDEAALSIHNLIVKNRGVKFINALYSVIEQNEELFSVCCRFRHFFCDEQLLFLHRGE